MKTAIKIAWRYLFAKKQFNAIHVITAVSSIAVGIVTAAMICVLSVMNGFSVMIEKMFSHFDPDLRITTQAGKSFHISQDKKDELTGLPSVQLVSENISEIALLEWEGKQIPIQLMGVDSSFSTLTDITHIIKEGKYMVHDGLVDCAVLGRGLAWRLGIRSHFISPIHLYAPKREGKVNMMTPHKNFNTEICYIAGIFAVEQQKYDDNMMMVDIDLTRRLLGYDSTEVTALQVALKDEYDVEDAKKEIMSVMGNGYIVQDRYEQQENFFNIFHIEKLLTTILLAFILLIATFNGIGSLSMLIIDKQQDIRTLTYLGASQQMIRKIFMLEGWLVNAIGAIGGLAVGIGICLLQQHYGWLKLGSGTEYVLSAYPVQIQLSDIALVAVIVLVLGGIASWIPTRKLKVHTMR